MDKDKIYQRIMLLKIIQSSGVETPYEMDLDLVGSVLLGKYYKIFTSNGSDPDKVFVTGTIRIDPELFPRLLNIRLSTSIMFFKKGNDLHLVDIGRSHINASFRQMMAKINAQRIYYYPAGGDNARIELKDFEKIDNIYYHPISWMNRDSLSFSNVLEAFQSRYINVHSLLFEDSNE